MKLKLLVSNTLPRPRRNRKKSSSGADLTLNNITARHNLITDTDPSDITWNKSLVTEDFHYLEKSALDKADVVNININLGHEEVKCGFDKVISPSDVSGSGLWEDYADTYGVNDANFNTVPRARTRIKTNPWLTSPKPSPAASCDSSPTMSHLTSPLNSTVTSPNKFDVRRKLFDFCDADTILNDSSICHKRERQDSVESSPVSEAMSCLQSSFTSDASDNSITANERQSGTTPVPDPCDPWQRMLSPIDNADQDVSGAEGEMDMSTESWQPLQQLESPVSFLYEEEFESQLEEEGLTEELGSQESLWGAGADAQWLSERDLSGAEHGQEEGSHRSLSDDGAVDSDGTLCLDLQQSSEESSAEDSATECPMQEILDEDVPLYQDQVDVPYTYTTEDSDWKSQAFQHSTFPEVTSKPSGRSLNQIRGSLQEKVSRLRKEKMVVDEKVRTAREEERLRQQEKLKLQRQMTLLRKQLLLRTLQDLRAQLHGQSQRLQHAYDHVMARHWEESRASVPLFGIGMTQQQPETAL